MGTFGWILGGVLWWSTDSDSALIILGDPSAWAWDACGALGAFSALIVALLAMVQVMADTKLVIDLRNTPHWRRLVDIMVRAMLVSFLSAVLALVAWIAPGPGVPLFLGGVVVSVSYAARVLVWVAALFNRMR